MSKMNAWFNVLGGSNFVKIVYSNLFDFIFKDRGGLSICFIRVFC